jgi:hypothetical protein
MTLAGRDVATNGRVHAVSSSAWTTPAAEHRYRLSVPAPKPAAPSPILLIHLPTSSNGRPELYAPFLSAFSLALPSVLQTNPSIHLWLVSAVLILPSDPLTLLQVVIRLNVCLPSCIIIRLSDSVCLLTSSRQVCYSCIRLWPQQF